MIGAHRLICRALSSTSSRQVVTGRLFRNFLFWLPEQFSRQVGAEGQKKGPPTLRCRRSGAKTVSAAGRSLSGIEDQLLNAPVEDFGDIQHVLGWAGVSNRLFEKHPLAQMGEPVDRVLQRKPVDRRHVASQIAGWSSDRVHAPELDDFRPPARLIGQRAEEFMDGHAMSRFLQHLAASRGDRILAGRELALRKPPRAQLTQLNDSELWSAIVAQHDSSGRQDRYTGFDLALLHRPHLLALKTFVAPPGFAVSSFT